jgi:hypothetical protein
MFKTTRILALTGMLTACSAPAVHTVNLVYSAANAGTATATDKGLTDRALTAITGADCDGWQWISTRDRDYYCEERDISRVYNRNTY